jgi:ribosome-associated toxin RatA of RatAB toxin-antitoxin module
MHIDAPKGAVTSLRDFASKYAMFVLSIVTALAFEQGAQWWYHSKLASEASRKIDAELRANIEEIRTTRKHNVEQIKVLNRLAKVLATDMQSTMADPAIVQHLIKEANNNFGLNMMTPTLRHEAWDVAVANQSASYMAPSMLHRYSAAYANVRDVQQNLPMTMQLTVNGPAMINVLSDMEVGKASAREVFHVLVQMRSAISELTATSEQLEKNLEKYLAPD